MPGTIRWGAVTDEMARAAMELFGPGPNAVSRIRAAYPDAGAEELYVLAYSDQVFRMPSLQLTAAHTAGGGVSHLYELTWPAPGMGGIFGACHFLDVPLVFGVLDQGLAVQLLGAPPAEEAREVSAHMQAAWIDFARHGDPGWSVYDEQRRATRLFDIGDHGGVRTYPEEASRKLWVGTPTEVIGLAGKPVTS